MAERSSPTSLSLLPYPYYSMQKAMGVAAAVRDLGGANGEVQKPMIAHQLGLADDSPSLMGILGAAKLYGMIDGRGAYRLTDVARQYFHPTHPDDSRQAQLSMIKSPPLFSALIDRFDGQRLPNPDLLANFLHREFRVSESWRTRVASLFLSAVRDVGIIDPAGMLRFRSSLQALQSVGNNPEPFSSASPSTQQALDGAGPGAVSPGLPVSQVQPNGAKLDVWTFQLGGDVVRLETSQQLSRAAWNKLSMYVAILKPEDEP